METNIKSVLSPTSSRAMIGFFLSRGRTHPSSLTHLQLVVLVGEKKKGATEVELYTEAVN